MRNGDDRAGLPAPGGDADSPETPSAVLRRVAAGEVVTITVKGKPVARLTAAAPARRRWLSGVEVVQRLTRAQADPGLRDDLSVLADDTTDDLGPIR